MRSLRLSLRISSTATEEFSTTFKTRRSPSSSRLATSTSVSRVSSATAPILRRYMRTGSLPAEWLSESSSSASAFFDSGSSASSAWSSWCLSLAADARSAPLVFGAASTSSMPSAENAASHSSI